MPGWPAIVSFPPSPLRLSWIVPDASPVAEMPSFAAATVHGELVGRLVVADRHQRREAGHGDTGSVAGDRDRVVPVGAVDDDPVGLAIACPAAGRALEVDVRPGDVGPGQVVDRDDVRAAESLEVDGLDVVRVHRDVPQVAEEPEAVPVRRHLEALGGVGAVEEHRVGAVLALDDVAAVTGVPDERVGTVAHVGHVVASVAVDGVVVVCRPGTSPLPSLRRGRRSPRHRRWSSGSCP